MNSNDQMAELRRNWTPPRELARSGPRETELAPAGVALTVVAAILFAGAVAAAIAIESTAQRQETEQRLLREQGVEVDGTIVRLWRSEGKDKEPMLSYDFKVGATSYRHRVQLPLSIWKNLLYTSPLRVRYVPSDPSINRPTIHEEKPLPHWISPLAGAALAALGVLLLAALRRARNLLSEGRPAPAVVTGYSNAQHGQKNIHYEFPLLNGRLVKGKSGPMRKVPPIGSTVCVIYDRDNPRRNSRYPIELVRVAGTRGVS